MVDLSERENGLWGREGGDSANTEFLLQKLSILKEISIWKSMWAADIRTTNSRRSSSAAHLGFSNRDFFQN